MTPEEKTKVIAEVAKRIATNMEDMNYGGRRATVERILRMLDETSLNVLQMALELIPRIERDSR